ncbi:altered inheritance of mitochondria protein 18, mitochondrial [Scheffersomyces amazonensis]|uniref:altered inheritance of mitochondria protein 18, mitochondrial n=1 Tax=Scheffersomyces amazonensis TaxID=1078765 RepID=UPI00315CE4EF
MFRSAYSRIAIGRVGRRSWSSFASSSSRTSITTLMLKNPWAVGLMLAGGIIGSAMTSSTQIKLDQVKEGVLKPEESVDVDSAIDPFPLKISGIDASHLHSSYKLLGHGVRSVTFVGFKVYGVGMYVAENDIAKIKNILQRFGSDDLNKSLLDEKDSVNIIDQVIQSKAQLLVRLSPVRNTDFNHLKDGITKSILAHPLAKQEREKIGTGLEQLKQVFQTRRGTVPKNHLLYLEVLKDGRLSISYEDPTKHNVIEMGVVEEPLISRTLMLQYLSGKKPLSDSLRKSCVDGFTNL